MHKYLALLATFFCSTTLAATPAHDQGKFTDIGLNLASVLGAADYCGGDSQKLIELFTGGLGHLGLSSADIETVLAHTQAKRKKVRANTAEALAGKPCPADVRESIQRSLNDLESAWIQAIQAETGVNLRHPPAASSTTAPPTDTPAKTASNTVPPGKYSCYTFDAGQLNYAYTDVVIHDASRYSVGDKSGNYQLAGSGAISFTGTLSNAVGKFAIKNTGKPQIDLVFNGDPRSSMACTKAR